MTSHPVPLSHLELISLSLAAVLLLVLGAGWLYVKNKHHEDKYNFIWQITKSILIPSLILIALKVAEVFVYPIFSQLIFVQVYIIIKLIVCLWIFACISNVAYLFIQRVSEAKKATTFLMILPYIKKSIKAFVYIILLNILFSYVAITPAISAFLERVANVLLVLAVAWFIFQLLNAGEMLVLRRYEQSLMQSVTARRDYTKVRIFKRILLSVVFVITFAAILMLFEQGRELGASILASAGLITAILGFAAQQPLATLLTGVQIAISQPIKIGDAVIVEQEYGTIEEIRLSYVVVRAWDLRKIIVPINYFIQKPFQNWTYNTTNLIAPVFLYFDYSVPLDELRQELTNILNESKLWDKRVSALQVTDAKENVVEIRILASAEDAKCTWDLRCEIREKMIKFVREHYPNALPRSKFILDSRR